MGLLSRSLLCIRVDCKTACDISMDLAANEYIWGIARRIFTQFLSIVGDGVKWRRSPRI